jgi:hypothetical protein
MSTTGAIRGQGPEFNLSTQRRDCADGKKRREKQRGSVGMVRTVLIQQCMQGACRGGPSRLLPA